MFYPNELLDDVPHSTAALFGVIAGLARERGYCWSPNPFLAKQARIGDYKRISRHLQRLEAAGWIRVTYKQEAKKKARRIYLTKKGVKMVTGITKTTPKYNQNNGNNQIQESDSNLTDVNLVIPPDILEFLDNQPH